MYSGNLQDTNFDKLVRDGFTGVIFKWGQGLLPDVPRIRPSWWMESQAAGLKRGIYWLNDARYKAPAQIESLKRATHLDFGELGLWADNEKPWLGMSDLDYWKLPYAGLKNIIDFQSHVSLLKAGIFNDYLPGFYTSPGFYNLVAKKITPDQKAYLAKAPLWTAQYPWIYIPGLSKPTKYGGWEKHTLWQYREQPDHSIFNGTQAEFAAMFGPTKVPPIDSGPKTYKGFVVARVGVKFRTGPGAAYPTAGPSLPKGTEVDIDTWTGDWAHIIKVDGQDRIGWSATRSGNLTLIDVEYE